MAEILLADDDRNILKLVTLALERRGHRIAAAEDGTAALELLSARQFDLVLTDLRMPGCSGLEVLAEARRLPQAPPVVIFSGSWLPEERNRAEALKAFRVLNKPFELQLLNAVVDEALGRNGGETKGKEGCFLLVGGDDTVRSLVGYCLRQRGYRPQSFSRLDDMEAALIGENPEMAIVFSTDGEEIIRVRQVMSPDGLLASVVSARDSRGVRSAVDAGVDDLIEEPISPEVLFARLELLDRRRMERKQARDEIEALRIRLKRLQLMAKSLRASGSGGVENRAVGNGCKGSAGESRPEENAYEAS